MKKTSPGKGAGGEIIDNNCTPISTSSPAKSQPETLADHLCPGLNFPVDRAIPIQDIVVGPRLRGLNEQVVTDIMKSVQVVGLINPVIVQKDAAGYVGSFQHQLKFVFHLSRKGFGERLHRRLSAALWKKLAVLLDIQRPHPNPDSGVVPDFVADHGASTQAARLVLFEQTLI